MKPATGFWGFIARTFSNEYKDLFITRLGVALLLSNFGIVGPVADILSVFIRGILGVLMEDGIYQIDLKLDALREGQKLERFKVEALKAYQKASAKVYTEEEKNAIRQEYLDIISRIGTVGDPKP